MKKHFGTRLKNLRLLAGLTQSELAELVGISDRYLGRMERGLVSPSFDCIDRIARGLRTEPSSLFLFQDKFDGDSIEVDALPQPARAQADRAPGNPARQRGPEDPARERAAILQCISGMTVKLVDSDFRIVWITTNDPEAPMYLGKDVIGQHCHEAFHGLPEPCPGCLLPRTLASGRPSEGEHTSPSGRTFLTRCNPMTESDGSVRGVVHMALDISARKNTEQALRHSQERLELLLAASPVVLYSCEPHGAHAATYISENMSAVFGHPPKAFLGNSSYWESQLYPGEKERLFARMPQLLANGHLIQEYLFKHGDGSWRMVRDVLRLLRGPGGTPTEIAGCMMDVTPPRPHDLAMRWAQSRSRKHFETANAAQLLVDTETGAILDANPAALDFYGHADMRGMTIRELDGREHRDLEALRAAILGSANPLFRFRHRLASGRERDVDVLVTLMEHDQREVLHFLVMEAAARDGR